METERHVSCALVTVTAGRAVVTAATVDNSHALSRVVRIFVLPVQSLGMISKFFEAVLINITGSVRRIGFREHRSFPPIIEQSIVAFIFLVETGLDAGNKMYSIDNFPFQVLKHHVSGICQGPCG